MGKSNFPNTEIDSLPAEFVTDTIESVQELAALGKITRNPALDQQFEDRVQMIIEFCKRKGLRLGVETLCAGLGISRQELHNWGNGTGSTSVRRQEGVKQIKQLIFSFLEQIGMSGKLNPTTYIWLSKNWMQYTDVIKIESDDTNERLMPQISAEEIAQLRAERREMPQPPDLD